VADGVQHLVRSGGFTTARHPRHNETVLDIPSDTYSDEAIQGLVEDWIAPMIVDQIIEEVLRPQEE